MLEPGRLAERTSTPGSRCVTARAEQGGPAAADQLRCRHAAVTLPWLQLASSPEKRLRGEVAHAPVGGPASCPSADTRLAHRMPCARFLRGSACCLLPGNGTGQDYLTRSLRRQPQACFSNPFSSLQPHGHHLSSGRSWSCLPSGFPPAPGSRPSLELEVLASQACPNTSPVSSKPVRCASAHGTHAEQSHLSLKALQGASSSVASSAPIPSRNNLVRREGVARNSQNQPSSPSSPGTPAFLEASLTSQDQVKCPSRLPLSPGLT